jgi:putative FmdB family regulatory protein
MPLFAYKCEDCPNVFEELLPASQDTHKCPTCGKESKKMWMPESPPLPIFKARGFYITDYGNRHSQSGKHRNYLPKVGE